MSMPKWPPYPTNDLEKKWPSLATRPGRNTAEKSRWPQGCGMYQAAVKSGALALARLSGVLPLVSRVVEQVVATPRAAVVQLVVAVGITPASEPWIPTGVAMTVSGVSAENDSEPPQ